MVFSPSACARAYFTQLPQTEKDRHPLVAFAEDEGVAWRRFDLSPVEVFDWLTPIFTGETAASARWLAACHISDIAWDDHPDYRAEQAHMRVLHMPAPGMDHRERATLALALAWRYDSVPRVPWTETANNLTDSTAQNFARRLGTALRLSYNLSGGAPGLLPRVGLRRTEKQLELLVPEPLRNQLGDVTERRLASVATAFDLKHEIRIV